MEGAEEGAGDAVGYLAIEGGVEVVGDVGGLCHTEVIPGTEEVCVFGVPIDVGDGSVGGNAGYTCCSRLVFVSRLFLFME